MLYYLPAEKAINLANEVFGFNGWSSSIRDTTIDFVSTNYGDSVNVGPVLTRLAPPGRSKSELGQGQLGFKRHHPRHAQGRNIP